MQSLPIVSAEVVSAAGFGADALWTALSSGCSALNRQEIGGQLSWIGRLPDSAEARISRLRTTNTELDRSVLLALTCAEELRPRLASCSNLGINLGSSRGATDLWESRHAAFLAGKPLPPTTSPLTTLGNISSSVAQFLGTDGPAFSHSVTCSTSAHAFANAKAWLTSGMSRDFLVGAAEASLTPFSLAQMRALRLYASEEIKDLPCKPLAKEHTRGEGLVLGEAAALFWLSAGEPANPALGWLSGVGCSQERISSATSIDESGSGFHSAMTKALEQSPGTIDAIILHAPGTRKGDKAELQALQKVFGAQVPPLYSYKWCLGHTYSVAAALGVCVALQMLQRQELLVMPYASEGQSAILPKQPPLVLKRRIERVMVNAAGFGGNVVSMIISRSADGARH